MTSIRSNDHSKALLPPADDGRTAAVFDDPELTDVFVTIRNGLARLEHLRGPERDAAYAWVEAFAAPYALAFFYALERLNATDTTNEEEIDEHLMRG